MFHHDVQALPKTTSNRTHHEGTLRACVVQHFETSMRLTVVAEKADGCFSISFDVLSDSTALQQLENALARPARVFTSNKKMRC